jgi:predicted phosphohydrolase
MAMAQMSRIFALGDLHLSFSSEKPMDIFGTAWERHDEKVRAHWLSVVAPEDTVFVLGDTSWALKLPDAMADLAWLHGLPGKKVLLRGNHDLWWTSISKLRALYDDLLFIQNDALLIGDVALCGSRGWITPSDQNFVEKDDKHIYERELIRFRLSLEAAAKLGGREIIAGLHFPPNAGWNTRSGFMDLAEEFGVNRLVYGHLHGREAFKKALLGLNDGVRYDLTSVDFLGFKPFLIHG